MSSSLWVALIPEWLRLWIRYQLIPALGLQPRQLALGMLNGLFDSVLFILLGLGFLAGGHFYMKGQYALPSDMQATVLKWAPIADYIAHKTDIPREVPLVLWFKENSMQAVNPESCTGIIGAYDLVRSGQRPCFTPGPISDLEISEQLAIAASEFKIRCPEITYYTQNPDTIKKCYFAYNAGSGAAARLDPDDSAYVMNNYDEAHQNMVYSDIELGTVRVTALGAWPAHLAIQSLIVSQWDVEERPYPISVFDVSSRLYDWAVTTINEFDSSDAMMEFPAYRNLAQETCIAKAHLVGIPTLRPTLNPVTTSPILTQDIHGCSYGLPGIDISSVDTSAVLQAPMPGEVTTYTDQWYNTNIRIENDEWIVWMLHPRSYLVKEGTVKRGQAVGVMGSIGVSTGPHVHYVIYDRINETFVDPRSFLP